MSTETKTPEFTGWRAIFWPIHGFEMKKFLPMALMMAMVLFNYTLLRNLKDAFVMNAPGSDAEVLSFLKLWVVSPLAILFLVLYSKMSNVFSPEKLFYATMTPFIIFFALFGFVFYPNIDVFHMDLATINALQISWGPSFMYFVPVLGNWSFTLFYALSELWGSVVLSVLFWQFANEITRVPEAKRFYAMFGVIGNLGAYLSGVLVEYFAGKDHLESTQSLMTCVVVAGALTAAIYYWMNRNVLTDPRLYEAAGAGGKKKSKPKLSLSQSFKEITSSPYLGFIAILVLAYGVSINLVEAVWKSQLKVYCGGQQEYAQYMGGFTQAMSILTIVFMFVGQNVLRRFKWGVSAMFTPLMMMLTSIIFFSAIVYRNSLGIDATFMGVSMLAMGVWAGTLQNLFAKSTKYSFFDPTKEMAYIPLDQELKVKGKAAVDGVGGRLGKSGGAAIQNFLLMTVFAGQRLGDFAYVLGIIVVAIVGAWIFAVLGLSKRYEIAIKQKPTN
jgi:AAA family ATP:ADP antiporter